jgi:GNAT superfamily N-acetyltransferase
MLKQKLNAVIRSLSSHDFDGMLKVINDAAQAYRGVIPEDQWRTPYMPADELQSEITAGVQFYGWFEDDMLLGVMGIQPIQDTTLIRHAYVLPRYQRRRIGGQLLQHLLRLTRTPEVLVGTWKAATWAIQFYKGHGFSAVSNYEKDQLLRRYWDISERQVETSIVLKFRRKST